MGKKRFTVLEGPDRGLTFSLEDGQSYVIGRDQPHDAGLNDEYAAAEHCELSMSDGRVCLRDLGSRDRKERRVGKECRSRWSPYH